jgi:leader peptidase (prepilin peptidase)/N-methyltransferase
MPAAVAALAGLFGAVFGSFLNVVVYRLPRGESVVKPRSRCPSCGIQIKPYDNVPILSWVWLRGRCRACDAPISARYPFVEALTGLLCVAAALAAGTAAELALGVLLVLTLVPVTLIDLEHRIIPNRILAPAAVLAVGLGLGLDGDGEVERLIAGAAAGGFLLAAALAYPRGMGMGDVKLAAVMGLCLGRSVGPAMLIALVTGVLVGLVIMARVGTAAGRKTAVPFAPFMALGGVAAILAGNAIVTAYLDQFA